MLTNFLATQEELTKLWKHQRFVSQVEQWLTESARWCTWCGLARSFFTRAGSSIYKPRSPTAVWKSYLDQYKYQFISRSVYE